MASNEKNTFTFSIVKFSTNETLTEIITKCEDKVKLINITC